MPFSLEKSHFITAIVYLHEECRFEAWLGGTNRKIQSEYINLMGKKNIGKYKLSQAVPGVDSIIETILVEKPDFDHPEVLKKQVERMTIEFINDITSILDEPQSVDEK